MERVTKQILLAAVGGWLAAQHSLASFIALQIEAQAEATNSTARALLAISNQGDEPALAVQVKGFLDSAASASMVTQALGANERCTLALPLGAPPAKSGTYPVVLKVYYTDLNGYPFSALSVSPLTVGVVQGMETVSAGLLRESFADEGPVVLALRTTAEVPTDVRVRVIVSDELRCAPPEQNLVLFPGETKMVEFKLKNVSARPGSSYPVFATVEYDDAGLHRAVIRHSDVTIEGQQQSLARHRVLWLLIVGVLVVAFVFVQFLRTGNR